MWCMPAVIWANTALALSSENGPLSVTRDCRSPSPAYSMTRQSLENDSWTSKSWIRFSWHRRSMELISWDRRRLVSSSSLVLSIILTATFSVKEVHIHCVSSELQCILFLTVGEKVNAKFDLSKITRPQLTFQPVETDSSPGINLLLYFCTGLQVLKKTIVQCCTPRHGWK